MEQFRIIGGTDQLMPEHPEVEFFSTGYCGGDAGHGGETGIRISCGTDININRVSDNEVIISTGGDWETEGFMIAMMEIADKLKEKFEVITSREVVHRV